MQCFTQTFACVYRLHLLWRRGINYNHISVFSRLLYTIIKVMRNVTRINFFRRFQRVEMKKKVFRDGKPGIAPGQAATTKKNITWTRMCNVTKSWQLRVLFISFSSPTMACNFFWWYGFFLCISRIVLPRGPPHWRDIQIFGVVMTFVGIPMQFYLCFLLFNAMAWPNVVWLNSSTLKKYENGKGWI